MVRILRRSRQPDLDALMGAIGAKGGQTQAAHGTGMGFEPLTQGRQQPVKARKNVLLQPDGIGQGQTTGKMMRRSCRRDRLRLGPLRLIKTAQRLQPDPAGQSTTGQIGNVTDRMQAQPGERGDGCLLKAQGRDGQRRKGCAGLSGRHDARRAAGNRRAGDAGPFGALGGP